MEHRIELAEGDEYRSKHYGIEYTSAYVYRTKREAGPSRLQVWSNLHRPNPHPGETKWGAMGPIGGDGKYLDPHNKGTDEKFSVLLSPEATVISAHGDSTGTAASGQVYAKDHPVLDTGDVLVLVYPDGREERRTLTLTDNYGRGQADLVKPGKALIDEEQATLLNLGARFLPQREGEVYTRPCVEIGGVQVYVYFGGGELRISTHYDTADPDVLTEMGTVPTRVSIGGDMEYFQG
jgi:hypothetical protein